MKMQTKIKLNMYLMLSMSLILLALIYFSNFKLKESYIQGQLIGNIIKEGAILSMLTQEISLHSNEDRPFQQWKISSEKAGEEISHIKLVASDKINHIMLLNNYYSDLRKTFDQLAEHRHHKKSELTITKRNHYLSQLTYLTQNIIDISTTIHEDILSKHIKLRRFILALETFTIISVSILTFLISYMISKSLIFALSTIEDGVNKISTGKLNTKISLDGTDELSEFSAAFDNMVHELQLSTKEKESLINKLNKNSEMLKQSNDDLKSFAYSVSHDLKAPLRHITGFINMLKQETDQSDEKISHYTNVIRDSSVKMNTLIEDLLTFSRVGSVEMEKTETNLNAIITSILGQFEEDITGRAIEVKVQDMPIVLADKFSMGVALLNLISNAIKYTAKTEKPKIEIFWEEADNNYIKICVKDNGAGFDMRYQDKLFGVFQRLHSKEDFDGNGIGLANVKRVITRHGGKVDAYSEIGKGATFSFTIPKGEL